MPRIRLGVSHRREVSQDHVVDHVSLRSKTGEVKFTLTRPIKDNVIQSAGTGTLAAPNREKGEAFLHEYAAMNRVNLLEKAATPGELRPLRFPFCLLDAEKGNNGYDRLAYKFEWLLGGRPADGYLTVNSSAGTAEISVRNGEDLFWDALAFTLRDGLAARTDNAGEQPFLGTELIPLVGSDIARPISRSGKLVGIGGRDEIVVWSMLDAKPEMLLSLKGQVFDTSVAPQQDRLAVAFLADESQGMRVALVDIAKKTVEVLVESGGGFEFYSAGPKWSANGRYLALRGKADKNRAVTRVYETTTHQLIGATEPAQTWIAVVWDGDDLVLTNGKCFARRRPGDGTPKIQDCPVVHRSPDGKYLITEANGALQIADGRGTVRTFSPDSARDVEAVKMLRYGEPFWIGASLLVLHSDRELVFDPATLKVWPLFKDAQLRIISILGGGQDVIVLDEGSGGKLFRTKVLFEKK